MDFSSEQMGHPQEFSRRFPLTAPEAPGLGLRIA
jgi:hypothetical protein